MHVRLKTLLSNLLHKCEDNEQNPTPAKQPDFSDHYWSKNEYQQRREMPENR